MLIVHVSDFAIIIVKGVHFRWFIFGISESEAIKLLENSVLENYSYR